MQVFTSQRLSSLRNAFLSGLLLLAPLAVTVVVFRWLLDQVGGSFVDVFFFFVPDPWRNNPVMLFVWNLLSTLIVMVGITVLGYLSRYVLGKYFGELAERLINRLPFVGAVYGTIKQVIDTFSAQKRAVFSQTVLVQFPRAGSYAIGFLTNQARGEAQARTAEDLWTIFVPTTPNPTSGFLIMLPKHDIIEMDMSITDGMKLIISGGAVTPPWPPVAKVGVLKDEPPPELQPVPKSEPL